MFIYDFTILIFSSEVQIKSHKTITILEAVVVASALDDMQAESRLAVVSRSLPRRYRHCRKSMAPPPLMLYSII